MSQYLARRIVPFVTLKVNVLRNIFEDEGFFVRFHRGSLVKDLKLSPNEDLSNKINSFSRLSIFYGFSFISIAFRTSI